MVDQEPPAASRRSRTRLVLQPFLPAVINAWHPQPRRLASASQLILHPRVDDAVPSRLRASHQC
jgi:hypothetical protein